MENLLIISDRSAVSIVKLIMSKQPIVDSHCRFGNTPLHYAVSTLDQNDARDVPMVEEIVSLLLEGGANPKETLNNLDLFPCLNVASMYGSARLVEMLLRHGASVKMCDEEGQNALHAAFGNISGTIQFTL